MRMSRRAANKEASYQEALAADIIARRATITSNPIGPRAFFQRFFLLQSVFLKVYSRSVYQKDFFLKLMKWRKQHNSHWITPYVLIVLI